VHNSEGRLVSTIVTREPEFSIDDVALLTAQTELEADRGPHGQPMSEATSGLADPNLRDRGYRYEAVSTIDYAAMEMARAQERLQKEYPDDPTLPHRVWMVQKVEKTPMSGDLNA
jgi:hypothetical protein